MADVEYLKTFVDDEKILASDTNNNNQYLLDQITEGIAKVQTYVEIQVSSINSSTSSQISTLTSTLNQSVPTGVVQAYAGSSAPTGWLLCNGAAISRTTYSALFTAIGTKFGSGNGSTTFNVPNLVNKFVEGSTYAGTSISAGLPNISGRFAGINYRTINGAFYYIGTWGGYANFTASNGDCCDVGFTASNSNSIYGRSSTVQPPALTMLYIIKY